MRITSVFFTLITAATLSLSACGGSGDDDGGDDDIGITPDAGNTDQPDADNSPATKGLGASCTPDAANPTGPGDCGAGMTCLGGLDGATGAFCTKLCDGSSQDQFTECDALLDGPGRGACVLTVTDQNNNEVGPFCAIICEAPAQVCSDCDSTCPDNYLQCTASAGQGVLACQ